MRDKAKKRTAQLLFLLLVVLYGAAVAASMGGLPARARAFPTFLIMVLAGLVALKLSTVASPRARTLLEPEVDLAASVSVGGAARDPVAVPRLGGGPDQDAASGGAPSPVVVWAWAVATLALIYLAGVLPGAGLAVVLYVRGVARRRWVDAASVGAVLVAFLYLVFGRLLYLPLGTSPLLLR